MSDALPQLTLRKREIVALLADCQSYKDVGETLGIAWQTVRAHVVAIAQHVPGPGTPLRRVIRHADALLAIPPKPEPRRRAA